MSQTLIRLYFMLALLVLSAHARKYRPKIFLASEVPEEINKEVFWVLGQKESPVVWIKPEYLCDNDTLTDNKIHAGRVLVVILQKKTTHCELNPEVPVLKWYLEEEEEDKNSENAEEEIRDVFSPTWLAFTDGNLTEQGRSTLLKHLRHAIKTATKNKEEFNARKNVTVASTSSFWMFVIIGLVVFIVLLASLIFCYRKNKEKQKAKDAEAAKKAAEEKLTTEKKTKQDAEKALKVNSASVSTETVATNKSWRNLADALKTSRHNPNSASGANDSLYPQSFSDDEFLRPSVPRPTNPTPAAYMAAKSTATPFSEPRELPYHMPPTNPLIKSVTPPPLLKETPILTPLTPTKPSTPLKNAISSISAAKISTSSEKKNPKSPAKIP